MKHTAWIMDCDSEMVKKIYYHFMQKFDNYQQIASEAKRPDVLDSINEAYDFLDGIYHNITRKTSISTEVRNEIRSTIKFTERLVVSELLMKAAS
jgi:malate synthase